MNLIDAYVTRVASAPYQKYDRWWVDVDYTSEGVAGFSSLYFDSKEEALNVLPGHWFLT